MSPGVRDMDVLKEMRLLLFSRPKKSIGVDVGTHSVKAVQMSKSGGRLYLEQASYALLDRAQSGMDPIAAMGSAVRACLLPLAQQSVKVGALPGQSVVIRYPRLPEMPQDRLGEAIEREAGQHIPYDLAEVFLDWTLLDRVQQGTERLLKVLLVAAKHETIDARVQVAESAEVQFSVLGVDSLALADAAEACDFLRVGETVALVNVGLTSVSIHFVKDGVSNFIRDVNWGARELIQAIARARRVEADHAERMLHESALEQPVPDPVPESPEVYEDGESPAPVPAKGASLLAPFEDEFETGGPVAAPKPMEKEKGLGEILSTPLTRLVGEIRRSFDYYEHELYESPVDRLILSGGIAHLPLLQQALGEELGVKSIETANPLASALITGNGHLDPVIKERPAQFMVAVGLAARGTAEL